MDVKNCPRFEQDHVDQGSPNFFLRGPDHFPFFNVGPGRSVTENYMGRSDYQYYCGDFIMILNVFIMLD